MDFWLTTELYSAVSQDEGKQCDFRNTTTVSSTWCKAVSDIEIKGNYANFPKWINPFYVLYAKTCGPLSKRRCRTSSLETYVVLAAMLTMPIISLLSWMMTWMQNSISYEMAWAIIQRQFLQCLWQSPDFGYYKVKALQNIGIYPPDYCEGKFSFDD